MIAVFRVDASTQIGSGHVMRCLTLAQKLKKEKQADVYFVMRLLEGNLIELVKSKGFTVFTLPKALLNDELKGYAKWLTVTQMQDAEETNAVISKLPAIDLLVVDSYAIDYEWESMLHPYVKQIMVIDDLANRKHDCDILLDQNYSYNMHHKYDGLVPKTCQKYIGPQYLLLREEFYKVKKHLKKRDGSINNILVFFGGSDLTNETKKAMEAIKLLNKPEIKVNVVVGASNKNKEQIKEICSCDEQFTFYCQVNNMAELMNEADLAIGAGGTTTWERCFMELPSIVVSIADNQQEGCRFIAEKAGVIYYLGKDCDVNANTLYKAIINLTKTEYFLMIDKMKKIFGGIELENW